VLAEEIRREAVSPGSQWAIPMFRADFPTFASKFVQIWPYLLADLFCMNYQNAVPASRLLEQLELKRTKQY